MVENGKKKAERLALQEEQQEITVDVEVKQEIKEQIKKIPEKYITWKSVDFDFDLKSVDAINPEKESNGLYLHGDTGSRKSSLAAAIVKQLLVRQVYSTLNWLPILELVQRVKSSTGFASKETPYQILKSNGRKKSILVLDDLGRERETDWDEDIINSFIWQAYDNAQYLIITSNLPPDELYPDPAVKRRLKELQIMEIKV